MSKKAKQRYLDDRLYPRPKVFEDSHGKHLATRVLTPSRFEAWKSMILEPLSILWQLVMVVLIMDGILSLLHVWTVFAIVPFDRTGTYFVMAVLFLVWHLELGNYYPVARFLLGKYLFIGIEEGNLVIGGRFRRDIFSLSRPVTFGLREFDKACDAVFMHSVRLELVMDQVRRITVIEILGTDIAEHIVTNANMLVQMGEEHSLDETDVDPNSFDDEDW